MLITYSPSFQAAYRPMASIRFFRHVFLGLFGLTPLGDHQDPVSLFGDRIYWTHYHKCYYAKNRSASASVPTALPTHCPRYIPREVEELQPRLIVMMGKEVAKCLLDLPGLQRGEVRCDREYDGIPCICVDFPVTGAEPEFLDVRTKLKPLISEVDADPVPPELCPDESAEGIRVHTEFEFSSLNHYRNLLNNACRGPAPEFANPIHREWFHREAAPRWSRYSFVLSCVSFMEDQLVPICAEIPELSHYVSEEGRSKKPAVERLLSEVLRATALEHVLDERLNQEIGDLRVLRNCIAHFGGRIEGSRSSRALRVRGVQLEPCGVARLSDSTCAHASNVVRRFVDSINHYTLKTE